MRKHKKRRSWMAGVLALILMLLTAGCAAPDGTDAGTPGKNGGGAAGGNVENTSQAKGRYIETQLETPKGFTGSGTMRRLSDGSLVILDTYNGMKSISKDNGKSWKTKEIKEMKKLLNGVEAEITSAAVSADGAVFFSYILWEKKVEGKTYPEKYVYQKPDGTTTEFELGIEKYHASLTGSIFSSDGRLFAATNSSNVYEIDYKKKTCKKIFSLESEGGDGAALGFNGGTLLATDGKKVYFYDLESGEMKADDETINDYVAKQSEKRFGTVICGAKNGTDDQTVYIAGCEGIAGHAVGGSVMERLADGALTSLGDPSKPPVEMLQNEDGSFLILYQDGELDSYVYDAEASVVPEQQITIYGLYDNETVRQAISMFRKKNKEVFVRFEVGVSGENGVTESDAIKNLNTKLLAGDGPDLILLDGMPMDSYEEKGMLADCSDVVQELEGREHFFDGIVKGFQRDQGLFAIPFRIQIPLLVGKSSTVSGVTDLASLADMAEKQAGQPSVTETVLGTYTAEEVLEKMYLLSADSWLSEEKTIDREKLKEFLTQAKRLYDADQKNLDSGEKKRHDERIKEYKKYYKDEKKIKQIMQNVSSVFEQLRKTQVVTAGYLTSMMDFQQVTSVNKKIGGQTFQAWNGQGQDLFCPTGTVGIAATSKNTELAKEFVRVLLGKDVQAKDLSDGFPVSADAFKEFTTNPYQDSSMTVGGEDKDGNSLQLDMSWPGQTEIEQLKKIIESRKTPVMAQSEWRTEVVSIGAKALTGEKGVEESVEEIVQKISLHLQE